MKIRGQCNKAFLGKLTAAGSGTGTVRIHAPGRQEAVSVMDQGNTQDMLEEIQTHGDTVCFVFRKRSAGFFNWNS